MKILKDILIIFLVTIAILVLINLCAGVVARNYYFKLDAISQKTQENSFGYFVPNQSRTIIFPGLKPYEVNINALGLRSVGAGHTRSSIEQKFKILCVGDSNTFGLFVDDESSFPYQLQSIYSESNQPVAVLNAGIGSTSIHDYLYYLQVKGFALKPDVVILNFTINDVYEIERIEPYYETFLKESESPIKQFFEHSNLGRAFRKLYVWHKYRRWLKKIDDPRARDILKYQKRNPEDLEYFAHAHHNAKILYDPYSKDAKIIWNKYFAYLDQVVSLLRAKDIPFVYNIHPEVLALLGFDENNKYKEVLFKYLKENNIDYLDGFSVLKNHENKLELLNNPPRDFHLNKKGNAMLAGALHERLKKYFYIWNNKSKK